MQYVYNLSLVYFLPSARPPLSLYENDIELIVLHAGICGSS